MMRQIVSAAFGVWLVAAQGVAAQAVVVELYTSQGCSSCPPADAVLAKLADQPGVIPLALHVDYWDYLGWQDKFANPRFTERQKAYAHAAGDKMIYTPQVIVGGSERVSGSNAGAIAAAIAKKAAQAMPVIISAQREGNQIVINLQADPPLAGGAVVQLVRYRDAASVSIKRGENAGRDITYRNIVTSWERLSDWPGQAPLALSAKAAGNDGAVVIVQRAGMAGILAAAVVE